MEAEALQTARKAAEAEIEPQERARRAREATPRYLRDLPLPGGALAGRARDRLPH